jgi:DNA-directed RNA polymerase specialized sigma24 family protein
VTGPDESGAAERGAPREADGAADPVEFLTGTDAEGEAAAPGDDTKLAALKAEHAQHRLGPLWLNEITRVCRRHAQRYPPAVYARATSWGEAEIEDLVMDTVTRMLAKNQIEYICDTAADLRHVRNLIHRQAGHALIDRKAATATVVDNLVGRAIELLRGDNYRGDPEPPPGWTLPGGAPLKVEDQARRLLGLRLRRLPRLAGDGIDRASPVWTTTVLTEAVDDCLQTLGKVTRSDLQEIFADALTSLVASEFASDEAGSGQIDQAASPEEHALATEAVDRLELILDTQERIVLARKLQDVTDVKIAEELRISRPTVDKRKNSGTVKVVDTFADLPYGAKEIALAEFQRRILEAEQQ